MYTKLLALTLLTLPFAACNSFSEEGPEGPVERIPSDEDSRLDSLGIICESSYQLSGSFAPGASEDPEDSCRPVGEWSITATLEFQGCAPQKSYGETRRYAVAGNADDGYVITYPADPNNRRIEMDVVSHGGADCEGQFDHYDDGGSVWTIRPVLSPDGSIRGTATYSLYAEDSYSD
jgi:hypothetical protein